ncbi:probable cytochrome P450 6a13 [Sipha flava]|uniref:Probable cytochrome P450 6a13 n=1 Tax=Sipha flava TaxID=143950 RepID=A0A8B8GM23_9HEMI|nr:probable cytochrome P450 6a13 [Sipha flava]
METTVLWSDGVGWRWTSCAATCLLLAAIAAAYHFCTATFGKWRGLGVPCVQPVVPLFGNFLRVAAGLVHPVDFYRDAYQQLAGRRYGGLYQMRTPYLMVRDPELIVRVLISDFASFTDRGVYTDVAANPLSDNLFFMDSPRWRTMRNKLSPAFTSGKLKLMHDQIRMCGDELMANVRGAVLAGRGEMEVRDVMGKYSTDVIGSCAFGLRLDAVRDDASTFRRYGKTLFRPSLRVLLRELCLLISPALLKVVRIRDFPPDADRFFRSAFRDTIENRENSNVVRNDFVNVLMQARRDLVLDPNLPRNEKFTESQIVANAFVMFAAGFETVSSALSFCLYELALKTHIQDRVREEFTSKLSKNNGVINNDFLVDLTYLDMVLAETLRKYPPTFALFRIATQAYQVPDDSLTIEKGQKLIIPIHSLHYNPKYFPDPEVFNPERFSSEEKAKRVRGTYLPFGDGPRICIGKRFAELEMKLALVEILSKFEVQTCERTEIPIKFSKKALIIVPENGIWLKFIEIKN